MSLFQENPAKNSFYHNKSKERRWIVKLFFLLISGSCPTFRNDKPRKPTGLETFDSILCSLYATLSTKCWSFNSKFHIYVDLHLALHEKVYKRQAYSPDLEYKSDIIYLFTPILAPSTSHVLQGKEVSQIGTYVKARGQSFLGLFGPMWGTEQARLLARYGRSMVLFWP